VAAGSAVSTRALIVNGRGELEPGHIEPPPLRPDEVGIDVVACGVCGSDLHLLASGGLRPGAVLGHEISGRIAAVGHDVSEWTTGERVTVLPFVPCGRCRECLDRRPNLCAVAIRRGLGLGVVAGGFSTWVAAPASSLFELPPGIGEAEAALTEPLAVALHGIRRASLGANTPVAVIGAGTIGLLTGLALAATGHDRAVIVEPNPARSERARNLGLSPATAEDIRRKKAAALDGAHPEVVFECAGHPSTANVAVGMVAPAGVVVLLGVVFEPVAIDQLQMVLKEVSLTGSFAYTRADFEAALEMLAEDDLPTDQLITQEVTLEDAPRIIAELSEPGTEHLKVVIRP
jgi:(R,R)-butanediol dehydrogenase/meso-butanediol dehydrogenase/diacetyl reductase